MRKRLDTATAEKILSGSLAPNDPPEGYAELAALLRAAGSPTLPGELARRDDTVKAMAEMLDSPARNGRLTPFPAIPKTRRFAMRKITRIKLGLAGVAAMFLLTTGLALAGHLPEAAQEAFARTADRVGLEGLIPHPGGEPGVASEHEGADGSEVSEAAKNEETSGVDKARDVTEKATGESQIPFEGEPSELGESPPAGPQTGEEHSGGASQTGSEAADKGKENAEDPPTP